MRENYLHILGILGVWALLYLPGLGRYEMEFEEGRRALAAREMHQSGSWMHSTVLQETYLNKPPGFSWLVLLASSLQGKVTEWSVRFPSAVATLATAFFVYRFAPDIFNSRVRFFAAALFLLTFMTSEKGRQGEIDAAFALFVWAALHSAWSSIASKPHWFKWFLSGVMLGGAFLLKGPPALLFYYGTFIPFYLYKRRLISWLVSSHHGCAILGLMAVISVWLVPLLRQLGWDPLGETLMREIGRRGVASPVFLMNQAELILRLVGGMLPGVIWLPVYFGRHRWKNVDSRIQETQTFLLCLLTTPLIFFLYFPGARVRYLYPVIPAVALLASWAWSRSRESSGDPYLWIAHRLFALSVVLGAGLTSMGAAWAAWHYPSHFICFAMGGGIALLLGIWLMTRLWDSLSFPVSVGQILVLACLIHTSIQARVVEKELEHECRDTARKISDWVPPSPRLYTLTWNYFGLFYYVDTPVIHIHALSDLPPGEREYTVVYGPEAGPDAWKKYKITNWETIPVPKGGMIWLIRLNEKSD
ncbi:MAG: phospholipid carrier-dependent glycosyltransferase [Candidatus Omnitrophica bacterium]|nr:phospholipid carrier-dependent glycosyltransferase [Candidatus Omnitrophota bacterium]